MFACPFAEMVVAMLLGMSVLAGLAQLAFAAARTSPLGSVGRVDQNGSRSS
jgi:hypothetical protein